MRDEDKTKKMLTEELAALRRQLADLKSHTSPDSRQIEDELRESRMLFSTTINTMVDILVCMDLEGKILFINDYALQVSGYSREEIEGRNMLSFIAPEDHARIIENTIRMMGKKLGPQEYNLLMKDGSIIPFEVNGDVLRDHEGRPLGIVNVCRNIADRKKTEEEIRKSEERYRAIVENTPLGIISIDGTGCITDVNSALLKILGSPSREQTMAINLLTFPLLVDAGISDLFRWCMDDDVNIYAEKEYASKWGRKSLLRLHITPVHDRNGCITGAMSVVEDITEQKRAEEEQAKLVTAIEQTAEGIYLTDTHWIIQYANPAFERMLGYERGEVIGWHTRNLKSGSHDKSYYRSIRETLAGGKIWSGRGINRRKDGTYFDSEVTMSPVRDKGGNIINYVCIHRDITREVALEERLRQSQKMEAIGTLAGGIAHDFNNILSGIMGFTQLYKEAVKDRPKVYQSMEEVLKAADRAKNLVKQILTFSRKTEQKQSPTIVTPIVKEIVKFMRASLPSTIEIKQTIETSSDVIIADPTQIHQVLMNLCTNAGHAMKETGGILEIGLKKTTVNPGSIHLNPPLKPGHYLEMLVRDTGVGIPQDKLGRIFEPYFTTKGLGEGAGLGLAVVHGIVRDHGGEIRVDSEEGTGSIFRIYMPLLEMQEGHADSGEEIIPQGKGETILFIDDEEMVVESYKHLLGNLNYNVLTATDPVKAVEMFKSRADAFDLVVTDKTMPKMTGFDVAAAIRSIRPYVPIILCSGFHEKEELSRSRDQGIDHLLTKPVKINELADVIRRLLDKYDSKKGVQ